MRAEYIGQGLVRSKKLAVVDVEHIDDEKENDIDDSVELKKMISLLQEEKNQMQKQIDSLTENKRRRETDSQNNQGKWNVGDTVRAKWCDNEFYTAKVQKVETMYHVVFTDDNKKRKVSDQDLKEMTE
ncbi:uncharacterized protein LOC123532931 [Mercenaria mercenaria]|uniref:uncharacterized protein LOC123532931 n=1 Tax=Mercenaria mercenaria TaxID=6596 RepID=UPI00234F0118|nr:uncharacterized protein LOC123532931 [Mercenaria mercenaria]